MQCGEDYEILREYATEGYRFTLNFFDTIRTSVMHIYHSCVPFAPRTRFWNAYTLRECSNEARVLQGHDQQWQPLVRTINLPYHGYAAAYSSDGSILAVGGEGFSQIFYSATGERRSELDAGRGWVKSVSFSCNDRTLATASDNSIRLWDVNTGSFITKLEVDVNKQRYSVAFHPRIDHVLVASINARVWAWDVRDTSRSTSFVVEGNTGRLCWLRTSGLQQHIIIGCRNGNMEMWDVELSQQVKVFSAPPSEKPLGDCRAVASSYDGSLVASGLEDGRVVVYNTNRGHSVHCFRLDREVMSVAFSPTEQMLACGLLLGAVRIFYLHNGRVISLKGHQSSVHSVAFSPDGLFLTSASIDEKLNIWETSAANSVALNEHHSKEIRSIKFLHNGNFLFTCSRDMTNKIWDTGTGALYATLKGWLEDAVVLSDGMHVISLSSNNILTLWDRRREEPLFTYEALRHHRHVQAFPYSHHTHILGFISVYCNDNDDVQVVCCWTIEPVHTDGPQMVLIASGTIPLESNVTRITHTGSMERDNLRLVFELEGGKKYSASWNDPTVFLEPLQALHFVEDSEQSLVEDAPGSLATKQADTRTYKDGAWILNEHDERALVLPPGNQVYRNECIVWYGQKLAVGGKGGQLTLVDFSNVNENKV
jgi:WD40 repeat protein